ncbi:MAG: hypothetical protein ACU0BS_12050 [Hasllibacter sp.]
MAVAEAVIAAANNADLCEAVMAANGLRWARDAASLRCLDAPPPFYPDLVTLDPAAPLPGGGWRAVKDSFAALDAEAHGFSVLFEASWIWRDPRPAPRPGGWERVRDAAALSEWVAAWGADGPPADVFPPAALEDARLGFLARRDGGRIVAGCIATPSAGAVGLSNVFGAAPYAEAAAAAAARASGLPVAGYERGAALREALDAGFRRVGPLRVLVR